MSSDDEVILLGPETVVTHSQRPIPKPPRRPPESTKISSRKSGHKAADDVYVAVPSALTDRKVPQDANSTEASAAPTSVVHTFFWPTKPTVQREVPRVFRTAFDTKNHPR